MTDIVIISENVVNELVTENVVTEIISVGMQGPQGIQGAGAQPLLYTAAHPISGHRVLCFSDSGNQVEYASSDNVAKANSVVGISTGAVAEGDGVNIQYNFTMSEPSWNWIPSQPIFCGIDGVLTQTYPTSGFSLIVAIAITANSIVVSIKQPIIIT